MIKLRSGRAPALPRGRWCAPDRRLSPGRHPPLYHGQSLRPRWNIPPAGVTLTRRQRRFTHSPITPDDWLPSADREPQNRFPPIFSSPAVPGWNKDHFGFDLGLRTPQLPATHAEAETGHRALARVLHPQHHHQSSLQRCLRLADVERRDPLDDLSCSISDAFARSLPSPETLERKSGAVIDTGGIF